MADRHDVHAIAHGIIGSGLYLVLGTADEAGIPWVSPVYYANDGWATFLWISSPEARHSRNISVRPSVAIVIFDSGAPISTGQAVYMTADAGLVPDPELGPAIEVFSRRSRLHGGAAFTADDARPPARLRLYRATATARWILEPGAATDRRVEVPIEPEDRPG
jgi:pyridoxamine 5'-phosphate oxidase-like protein